MYCTLRSEAYFLLEGDAGERVRLKLVAFQKENLHEDRGCAVVLQSAALLWNLLQHLYSTGHNKQTQKEA